jgi:hypothetical protein
VWGLKVFRELLALGTGPERGWPMTCRGVVARAHFPLMGGLAGSCPLVMGCDMAIECTQANSCLPVTASDAPLLQLGQAGALGLVRESPQPEQQAPGRV